MTVLAVGNQAGSAGKTTFVVNAAATLALTGRRVRVIDLDAQANASHWLGLHEPDGKTVRDVLLDEASLEAAEYPVEGIDGLMVVPSKPDLLEGVDVALAKMTGGEQHLRIALEDARESDEEDGVITFLDCPGSLGVLTVAALIAANAALTVFTPMEKEAGGIARFEATIRKVRRVYPSSHDLDLRAVVPSIVPPANSGQYYHDVYDEVTDGWGDIVTPPIRRSVRVGEAYSAQQPLPVFAPDLPVTHDVAKVVDFLLSTGVL
jgi:chromosome partitioning protein